MGDVCSTRMAKSRNEHRILVVKPKEKILFGRICHSWGNNMKMHFKKLDVAV